jgi:hypothetical protein
MGSYSNSCHEWSERILRLIWLRAARRRVAKGKESSSNNSYLVAQAPRRHVGGNAEVEKSSGNEDAKKPQLPRDHPDVMAGAAQRLHRIVERRVDTSDDLNACRFDMSSAILNFPLTIVQHHDASNRLESTKTMSQAHAPHDHAVEHSAHSGDPLGRWVAVFTAVLAAIAGLLHYQEGVLQTKAILFKNEAVLLQSKTSDQWNMYQAQSSKGHLMEIAAELAQPGKQDGYRAQVEKYEQRKRDIFAKADAMEKQVDEANAESARLEGPQHLFGQAIALVNVAISLAAITVLTASRKLFVLAGLSGVGGVVLSVFAFLHI